LWIAQMILVLNAGSSSLKVEVFDPQLRSVLSGAVTNIGTKGILSLSDRIEVETQDHADALAQMLAALAKAGVTLDKLTAAAHRVVHGGTILTQPARVTDQVIAAIESVIPLAPLHNPHNLAGMRALAAVAPDLPQYCSFGTASWSLISVPTCRTACWRCTLATAHRFARSKTANPLRPAWGIRPCLA